MPDTITPSAARLRLPLFRLSDPLTVDPGLPADPALRALADDVIAHVKLAVTTELAGGRAEGRIGEAARALVASRPVAERAIAVEHAKALIASPVLRQAQFRHLATATALKPLQVQPSTAALLKKYAAEHAAKLPSPKQPSADEVAGAKYKKLYLCVNDVHCFEESDEVGSDEIALGGMAIGALGGQARIDEFMVSDDFDEGESVNLFKRFAGFNLHTEPGFPYSYTAIVTMAEKDDGGFHDFLVKLWDAVGEEVKEAVTGAVGAAVGAAIGTLGGVIGTVVGAIVGALVGWLISLFDNEDEILGTRTLRMTLGAATKSYYDWAKLTSPDGYPFTVTFRGDNSNYRLRGCWRVAAS